MDNKKNIMEQLVELARSNKRTDIPALDAKLADDLGQSRMALPVEKERLLKAARDPMGSRMVTSAEMSGLEARKKALKKMKSRGLREAGEELGEKALKKGLGRAAGLAIGGPMMLASELADASELGPEKGSRDAILESAIPAEEKKLLLDKLARREKILSPDYEKDQIEMARKVQDLIDRQDDGISEEDESEAEKRLRKIQILRGQRFK